MASDSFLLQFHIDCKFTKSVDKRWSHSPSGGQFFLWALTCLVDRTLSRAIIYVLQISDPRPPFYGIWTWLASIEHYDLALYEHGHCSNSQLITSKLMCLIWWVSNVNDCCVCFKDKCEFIDNHCKKYLWVNSCNIISYISWVLYQL